MKKKSLLITIITIMILFIIYFIFTVHKSRESKVEPSNTKAHKKKLKSFGVISKSIVIESKNESFEWNFKHKEYIKWYNVCCFPIHDKMRSEYCSLVDKLDCHKIINKEKETIYCRIPDEKAFKKNNQVPCTINYF
jgi:hypothetical protein